MEDAAYHTSDTDPNAPQKQSLGARTLVAAAFSAIGAKLGFIGTVMDVNHLFKDKEMTLGKKMHAVFSPEIIEKTMVEVRSVMRAEKKSMLSAIAKVNKFGITTTMAGVAVGAILGWVRGGRIEHWKDIFDHPIESTEIILGLKAPHASTNKDAAKQEAAPERAEDSPANNSWQQQVASTQLPKQPLPPHTSHVEALAQEIPSGQGVTL